MTEKKTRLCQADDLRMRAEEITREKAARMPENLEPLSPEEARQALHELRVHQIELEMQNEELRRTQAELEASRARYFDLYDLAPVGYFTLSEAGLILDANLTAATQMGVARSALVKQQLTSFIAPEDQDIFYQHRKLLFETGAPQVCEMRMVRADASPFWARLEATAAQDAVGALVCCAVMSDITERKWEEALLNTTERLRRSLACTVKAISMAVEMKDPYTVGHQRRMADLARAIATEMVFSADRTDFVRIAATIHDIGKIAVPTEILSKPTKLTEIEFGLIKTHSQAGYEILKGIEFPWPVAEVILQHHERMDGSGYPRGLKGDAILLEARIMTVADVVEAIASHRPYRPALGLDLAIEGISKNRGILYDPEVVDACLKLFHEKGYHFN